MTPMKNRSVFGKSFMRVPARGRDPCLFRHRFRPDDEAHHLVGVRLLRDQLGHLLPAAHDDHAVGHLEHVVHLVADDDDPDPVGLQEVDRGR